MFFVSEYFSRIEDALLDFLESLEPMDKTITLWWGLDGLQINEDGTTEWVSREKRSPSETVFYQPCQPIQPIQAGMLLADQTQSTRAQIDALMAQRAATETQCLADVRNAQMANMLQQCCAQPPAYYAPYRYAGCCCSFVG